MSKRSTINPCPSGHTKVEVRKLPGRYYVACEALSVNNLDHCWYGPDAKTRSAAIKNWNR